MPQKGDAIVAVGNGEDWDIDVVFDPGHDGWDTRLIVASDGTSHMSAIDPMEFNGNGVEYYSQDASGNWTVEQVGSGPITYKYATSVAVGPDATPDGANEVLDFVMTEHLVDPRLFDVQDFPFER